MEKNAWKQGAAVLMAAVMALGACTSLPDRRVAVAPLPRPAAAVAAQALGRGTPEATWPGSEHFPDRQPNGLLSVAEQPVSTFSADVDTASYAFMRRHLTGGYLPPVQAVRVEEMVNYFPYDYPAPADRARPFSVTTTVMPAPWNAQARLLHIGVRGYDTARAWRPRGNVVLLIDISGSMAPPDRLPLLQRALHLFVAQLRDDDRVAIVTYANDVRVALHPTSGSQKDTIAGAIDRLHASGGTAGGAGLQRAFALAARNFDGEAVNRVILATDGDFNVGITDPAELERFIAGKRNTGIYFSILGVGTGNLNDALMQRLAQAGNGHASYIDTLLEARKVLSQELASTLFPIADDVKFQVEFNPAQVGAYRLIGYETRMLRREDFKDDKVDAGDIGAGHSVTAIYELLPPGSARPDVDPLRYQGAGGEPAPAMGRQEIAFVKVRYKLPGESLSRLIEQPVHAAQAFSEISAAPAEQRFAVAVAAFGQRLRGQSAVAGFGYAAIADLASAARGEDAQGYRGEFVRLVRMADTLGPAARR